jgi:hypothetical protein
LLTQLPTSPADFLPHYLYHHPFNCYGIGNILNLAIAANISLAGWNLRRLRIAEVDLQNLNLQELDCREAHFDCCRFSQYLGCRQWQNLPIPRQTYGWGSFTAISR